MVRSPLSSNSFTSLTFSSTSFHPRVRHTQNLGLHSGSLFAHLRAPLRISGVIHIKVHYGTEFFILVLEISTVLALPVL